MANILDNDIAKVALIAVAIFLVYKFFSKESMGTNYYGKVPEYLENVEAEAPPAEQPLVQGSMEDVQVADKPALSTNTQEGPMLKAEIGQPDNRPFVPEDLLPQYDEANEFANQNPVSKLLKEQNFLISGYHMGINTVMQSNKIPYHDLRSAPPVPKEVVSPFLNSSYETPMGYSRKMLEIL